MSLAECLKFLIAEIRTARGSTQPIFFVIEELDQFVVRRKQKLLYTLLDTLHTVESKSTMALIGTTTVLDISETLEKRVSSRFASTRQIFFFHLETLDEILKVLINALTVPVKNSQLRKDFNKNVMVFIHFKYLLIFFSSYFVLFMCFYFLLLKSHFLKVKNLMIYLLKDILSQKI